MSEDLLPFYNRELAFLRHMGAEFARAHPKVAGRLRLGPDSVEDPHVARLIESAAFLNARIRHKLEDDFPELTDALLGVLYPHYLAPIPSMAIVQIRPTPDLSEEYLLPAGTALETDRAHGEPCRYRTCYPTSLLPLAVQEAQLTGTPFDAPATPRSTTSVAALRIVLQAPADGAPISALRPRSLRFFLGGQLQHALALYELLLNDVVEIALASSPRDREPQILAPSSLRPVGFAEDEGMLPYPKRSLPAYRLLTEYFAFPSKFLFLELGELEGHTLAAARDKLEIYFYLRRTSVDLQRNVGPQSFALGCTPIVNLFRKRAEPVRLTHREPEVRVVPDARRPLAMEVYSVDAVSVTSPDGKQHAYRPFYGVDHGAAERGSDKGPVFYQATRRSAAVSADQKDKGTEVWLQFVDLDFDPSVAADSVLSVETTCLNRDLPGSLPFGGDQPRMALSEGGGPIQSVRCLTAPTQTSRPRTRQGARWRLISHLSLNHLSLSGDEGTKALKEILRLYEFAGTESNLAVVDAVLRVSGRPVTMRVPAGLQSGFCRGTEVSLQLDEERFSDHGVFLFASVLEAFFGLYCNVNSFVQLAVTTNGREGELRRWPPRAGTGPLL